MYGGGQVAGFGFRVSGFGFRVLGFGCRVPPHARMNGSTSSTSLASHNCTRIWVQGEGEIRRLTCLEVVSGFGFRIQVSGPAACPHVRRHVLDRRDRQETTGCEPFEREVERLSGFRGEGISGLRFRVQGFRIHVCRGRGGGNPWTRNLSPLIPSAP